MWLGIVIVFNISIQLIIFNEWEGRHRTKTESRMQYKDNFIWEDAYLYYSYYLPLFVVPTTSSCLILEWRTLIMIMMMYWLIDGWMDRCPLPSRPINAQKRWPGVGQNRKAMSAVFHLDDNRWIESREKPPFLCPHSPTHNDDDADDGGGYWVRWSSPSVASASI